MCRVRDNLTQKDDIIDVTIHLKMLSIQSWYLSGSNIVSSSNSCSSIYINGIKNKKWAPCNNMM